MERTPKRRPIVVAWLHQYVVHILLLAASGVPYIGTIFQAHLINPMKAVTQTVHGTLEFVKVSYFITLLEKTLLKMF